MRDAEIVRLVVADEFWEMGKPNRDVVAPLFAAVAKVAPAGAMVITPAGFLTDEIARPPISAEGLLDALRSLSQGARQFTGASVQRWLLGLDGCTEGTTPVQSVVLLGPNGEGGAETAVVKLYPADGESSSLLGWWLISAALQDRAALPGGGAGLLSKSLLRGPLSTPAGAVGVLICHEVVAFVRNPRRAVTNPRRQAVQGVLHERIHSATYVTVQAHHLTKRHGFLWRGARDLREERGSNPTVVFSMFAPADQLEETASKYAPEGPDENRVVTLLVWPGR